MSRIFKVSGNFMQYGAWSEPDPSFSGKIVVDDDDEFYGYCDELYASEMSEANRTRYLAGAFANNGRDGQRGIAFYKLSNDEDQAPLMYVAPNLEKPESASWAALWTDGCFYGQGKAKIIVEEEDYSEEEAKRIEAKYDVLDKSIDVNDEILEQLQTCKDIIENAK